MAWMTELPQTPGAYWARAKGSESAWVIQVDQQPQSGSPPVTVVWDAHCMRKDALPFEYDEYMTRRRVESFEFHVPPLKQPS